MSRVAYIMRKFSGIARLRAAYWFLLKCYEYEVCQSCGRPVGLVWTAPDDLWRELVSEDGGGIRCIPCFDALSPDSLRWVPRAL